MELIEKEQEIIEIVKSTNIKHIAIIMDGNRRWAKEKHFPSAIGHQKGVSSLKATLRACKDFGVKYLTVYAFSTENWNRTPDEVNFLMALLAKTLLNEVKEMDENGVRIRFIGNIKGLSPELQKIVENAENETKDNVDVNLQIAFNYGSKMEITNACKQLTQDVLDGKIKIDEISEELLTQKLYTNAIPDPDLLIRTGGEKRISNYLLWQLAYAEIYVTDKYWPDFDKNALADAIEEYGNRSRRFGK